MTTKFKFLFASLALASITTLSAQTVGYVTRTINPGINTISTSFNSEVPSGFVGQSSGSLTAVTSSTITNSAAAWTSGFVTAAAPYFVRITSGNLEGRTFAITSATSTVLTLSTGSTDLVTAGLVAGDTYKIFPAETLGTTFASVAVQSGANVSTSDNVLLWNGVSWQTYWFDGTNWRLGASATPRNNIVISPDTGVIYNRRGATAITYISSGTVPSENLDVPLQSGITCLGGLYPVDKTLGQLDVENTSGWKSVNGSTVTSTTADKVMVWNGVAWQAFYHDTTFSPARWRLGASTTDRSNAVTITAGQPVLIQKSSAAAVFSSVKPY